MGKVLHGSATTTAAIRRAIQHNQASLRELARRYGIDPETVAKRGARDDVADRRPGPKALHSTVLMPEKQAITETQGVARSNLKARKRSLANGRPAKRRGRNPLPVEAVVTAIESAIGEQPSCGYLRVWAMLHRQAMAEGRMSWNRKQVYRETKAHKMPLSRYASGGERRHNGKIAAERSNLRWYSHGFDLAGDAGNKVRVALALNFCKRRGWALVSVMI